MPASMVFLAAPGLPKKGKHNEGFFPMDHEIESATSLGAVHTDTDTAPRGRPFAKGASGNPYGRPLGARNKSTLLARALLDEGTRDITDRVIALALAGDPLALKLCFERILPRKRDVAITLDLPPVETIADCSKAIAVVIAAVAAGEFTPKEGRVLITLIEGQRRCTDYDEMERRLTAIEAAIAQRNAELGAGQRW